VARRKLGTCCPPTRRDLKAIASFFDHSRTREIYRVVKKSKVKLYGVKGVTVRSVDSLILETGQ